MRAEEEAAEQEARVATLTADRDDLTGAIERLRRGIQSLNREGRERLLASFEKVNGNFQQLFTKLFEGGEAKLTFTESDDPLEAGLEIFARPPGKRLQSLGLLSGGEQALTAMALIFAVFLVNPAPVCVLDEVDAPLDDANVERFCKMLTQMTEMSGTRFLVITHHALTMSRMDRLFGVTMAERGISQLVSVTLAEAEKIAGGVDFCRLQTLASGAGQGVGHGGILRQSLLKQPCLRKSARHNARTPFSPTISSQLQTACLS